MQNFSLEKTSERQFTDFPWKNIRLLGVEPPIFDSLPLYSTKGRVSPNPFGGILNTKNGLMEHKYIHKSRIKSGNANSPFENT